jgi:ribose transport system substrate-binding protein
MEKKGIIFSIGLMGIVLVILFAFYQRIDRIGTVDKETYETYERHYAMITDEEESELWDQVYESALEEGKQRGVYVERFGDQLAVDYDRNQLLQIAVQASVDGIIVTGDENEETVALIDEAVDQGIPVVTALRDSSGSRRQCFVGSNSYSIGQEYGRQIQKLLSDMRENTDTTHVLVLMDENRADTSQNLILLGIRETLEKELEEEHTVAVDTALVDNVRSFGTEESIRDIFLDSEQIPDILVCLNAVYTRCAYQAAVDYSKVGTVQILGYYDSDAILEALSKNIIDSTITLDTEQMGQLCVQALEEYVETGYTNSYQAVDTRLITSEEAKLLLEQR